MLKSVINERNAKVRKKRWNAYYFVGNLAPLWCKGFSHYFQGGGGEKERNFADLRKVGLDTSQGKGLKWRDPLPSGKWNQWKLASVEVGSKADFNNPLPSGKWNQWKQVYLL